MVSEEGVHHISSLVWNLVLPSQLRVPCPTQTLVSGSCLLVLSDPCWEQEPSDASQHPNTRSLPQSCP